MRMGKAEKRWWWTLRNLSSIVVVVGGKRRALASFLGRSPVFLGSNFRVSVNESGVKLVRKQPVLRAFVKTSLKSA